MRLSDKNKIPSRKGNKMTDVINIFRKKEENEIEKEPKEVTEKQTSLFEEAMRRNEKIRERMREDRSKANKSVLREYRIKT